MEIDAGVALIDNEPLRIVFAGTPEFAIPPLRALSESPHRVLGVYTQPDRPAGRGRKISQSAVKQEAVKLQLPCFQPKSLKDPEQRQALAALAPDVMVVVAYGQLLPQDILTVPRKGCINIHASLLPRWRGAAPIQRAILAGDSSTGVSIMVMEQGLDTGPVLSTASIDIDENTTTSSLHDSLSTMGAELITPALEGWCSNNIHARPQSENHATYANKISKAEANIDWYQSAELIHRQVRAFNPWPVAQTTLANQKIRIWRSQIAAAEVTAAPGTVLRCEPAALEVATTSGSLLIQMLQLPGKKPIASKDFCNSNNITGKVLGND